jgi:acetyl/propionyl-CoA carboxylase alpha subunit
VTEVVEGLDSRLRMLDVVHGNRNTLFSRYKNNCPTVSVALVARLHAEDPLTAFWSCAGRITELRIPPDMHFDTWIEVGTQMVVSFDRLLRISIDTRKGRKQALESPTLRSSCCSNPKIQMNSVYLYQVVVSSEVPVWRVHN